jgi:branched-subunit amino acid transport protein
MPEMWVTILVAAAAVYSWKLIGFLIPSHFSKNVRVAKFAATLTIALLAALTAVQTFTAGKELVIDSRLLAVGVAALMFAKKLPFIVVVATAAAVAAGARYFLGWQ